MKRRSLGRLKARPSKVRKRSMYDRTGATRIVEPKDMPNGCSYVSDGVPCTKRLTHVDVKWERRFVPEEQEMQTILKLVGWCKQHRPKTGERVFELPPDLQYLLNGPKSQRSRKKRLERALYEEVVPRGGVVRHLVLREDVNAEGRRRPGTDWVDNVTTLCEKNLKVAYIPSASERRNDYPKVCPKCDEKKEVA